ncbi:MAG: sulfurtransferase TusA family protein [Bacteroides sp.]
MRRIDLRNKTCPLPLMIVQEALDADNVGELLEVVCKKEDFESIKDYLSELNIGFREIYGMDKLCLQFSIPER